ncbi:hypothetical protein SAMN05518684_10882 [Salipaludibacillus aurantiacus]|uniref:Uncharacterized protein n=1 Tax=Salipaludibacillus aurantiacus TaxID=1601833 RepID=A0A1H9UQI6_9BACI|nr:hypothetical protein SAMN05518684_10882 [Salipaludibacillus aurantiacus]
MEGTRTFTALRQVYLPESCFGEERYIRVGEETASPFSDVISYLSTAATPVLLGILSFGRTTTLAFFLKAISVKSPRMSPY